MHESWNNGALDSWVASHLKANPKDGHNTMGYYTRQDLPFFNALAEALPGERALFRIDGTGALLRQKRRPDLGVRER